MWTAIFQALKICGHRSILAFALSVQHWKFQNSNRNARWKFCRAKRVKRQSPCSWSPFTPNAVPTPVLQRRWQKVGITFGRLIKFSRYVSHKEKCRPSSAAMDFVGVNRRQNESGVLRGGSFFRGFFLTEVVGLTVITNHFCRRFAINLQVQWDLW